MKTRLLALAAIAFATSFDAVAASAMTISRRIPGPDGGWDYASVDSEGHRLFVARGEGVQTIDLTTGVVTPMFVPGQRVHAALIMSGTGMGLSTNGTTNTATIFDAATGAIKATIPTGLKPDAAIWDAVARRAYIMNGKDGTVNILDPRAMKITGTVKVGGALEFAASDGAGRLYVNVEDKSEIAQIDLKSKKVIRRTKLKGCEEPSGLALTHQGTLIAACANGVAKVVDAESGRVLPDIAIGPRPDAVLYDGAHDRAYIPSGGDATLSVIDTSKAMPRKIDSVATQAGARTGAVDPATGNVYLPAARYGAKVAGEERPKAVPGSFEVLVLAN